MESNILMIYIIIDKCLYYNYAIVNCVDLKFHLMNLKIIFTWWNRQTLGTFLKTLFTGIFCRQRSIWK